MTSQYDRNVCYQIMKKIKIKNQINNKNKLEKSGSHNVKKIDHGRSIK